MNYLTHENELTWNSPFQVLYFNALWVPFKQKLIFMLDKVAQKYPAIALFAIDVDHFKSLCKRFNVDSVPTVLIMESGKEVKRIRGVLPTREFVAIFDDICIA